MTERDTIARAAAALDDPDVRREATAPRAVDPLREALTRIAEPKYGLQGIMEDYSDANAFNYHAMKYWRDLAVGYGATARTALAAAPAPQPTPDVAISRAMIDAAYKALPPDACGTIAEGEMERVLMAALRAAAPQPASVDREALADLITDAELRWQSKGPHTGPTKSLAIADALIAAGLRLPGAVRPDEMLAWAAVGESGRIDVESIAIDPDEVRLAPQPMQRVVRVAIRRVEDEA